MSTAGSRPVTVLVAALGGEGGGVLTNWLVAAAGRAGLPVQSTSIPGVAQRTGATTYYVEIFPEPWDRLEREPIFSLTPGPGDVDLMIASEALEAGRAMENGFVSPERTTLIASTHRIYAVEEKAQLADGRYDAHTLLATAESLACQPLLRDYRKLAEETGSVVNAVLLGAIAASGRLPFDASHLETAIREGGVAVEANLAGFARGRAAALEAAGPATPSEPALPAPEQQGHRNVLEALLSTETGGGWDGTAGEMRRAGLAKVLDFQDREYGRLYLERLAAVRRALPEGADPAAVTTLLVSFARGLANWMAYDDIIRVAELKTRLDRFERIRGEARAAGDEPLRVTDYFRPGAEEIAAVLPPPLARPLLAWVRRKPARADRRIGLKIRTTSAPGYLLLRALARLRALRRRGHRFQVEDAAIRRWLEQVGRAAALDADLAREVSECAALIRGYGETHDRGRERFERILARVVTPGLADGAGLAEARHAIAAARGAAEADPDGEALGYLIEARAAE